MNCKKTLCHCLPKEPQFSFAGATIAKLSKFSMKTYINRVVRVPTNEIVAHLELVCSNS